ncbi:MAG: thioredoxin family protein [Nitrospirales bacterium]|nr:thioredoxin family protein [Nitrospirales bacterium]
MRKKLFLLVVALLGSVVWLEAAFAEVQWYPLHEGREKAREEKKPLIVDFFYGKGCPRCEALQSQVYDNPSISRKIMEDFIPVRIDLTKKLDEEEEMLGDRYEYKKDCMLLFLDPQGEVIKTPQGKGLCFTDTVDPESFIRYLDFVKAHYRAP